METARVDHKEALKLNAETVTNLLVQFIKDETQNAGFSKGVIGVSGGVDSAVSAYLTAKALGTGNTYAVILPYETGSPQSVRDAEQVVRELGIKSETIDISPMVDAYCEKHKVSDKVRKGNVMARVRMIVLYDVSAREKALVIGTSNKTELLLGYGTLYGDTASAINPLGDLYKTQVWQVAEFLGVPKGIVSKKPTADLWAGQTDEGELGFTYREVDQLLFQMIDERRSDEELGKMGFSKDFVKKVRSLIRKNQFKRRPPVIAKVSYRTLNVDFRYVRDWGI
ncbi:MAG: NAD+ synthase [Ignavibacteriales bacterium]|nr:NAD+ synthase [Ignavibacteriales bacterium]